MCVLLRNSAHNQERALLFDHFKSCSQKIHQCLNNTNIKLLFFEEAFFKVLVLKTEIKLLCEKQPNHFLKSYLFILICVKRI